MIDTSDQSSARPVYTTALYEAFKASRESARLSLLSHSDFELIELLNSFQLSFRFSFGSSPDLVLDSVPDLGEISFLLYSLVSFPISLPSDTMRLKTGSPSFESATSAVKPSEFTEAPAPSGT